MIPTTSQMPSPAASPRLPPPLPSHDDSSAAPSPPPIIYPSPVSHAPRESPTPPAPSPFAPAPVETPPEASNIPGVDYFPPPPPPPPPPPRSNSQTPPTDRSFLTPPPPPPPTRLYAPPVPEADEAASPPYMLKINGTSPPSHPKSDPPNKSFPPPSSSSSGILDKAALGLNKVSGGEIAGICGGVGGLFLILVVVVLMCVCRRKKNEGKVEDCESPPSKEKLHAEKTKHLKKGINAGNANESQALGKPFLLSPTNGDSHSNISEPENQFSPRAPGMVLGFSIGNFTYQELEVATGGFSKSNLLGEGGFGYVHKGILPTGRQIAVKQLKIGSRQGEREFQAEVETISRVHHRHLVSLVGYCIAGVNRLLVYEFVPNGTLLFHLRGKARDVMDWDTRLKIAIGSARGLAYLHEDCNPTIIHRDIKTSNILLDSKFEAKVSDFGLAKFFSDADHVISHVTTRVVGTFGYLAPEYVLSGKASDKSDVFSFGVVLLELITGLDPIITSESYTSSSLVTWARPLLRRALEDGNFDGLIDPRLQNNYDIQEMAKMVSCAAACVRQTSWRRPRMSQIVRALEGDIALNDLDEEVRPGQNAVSGCLNVDLRNMDKVNINGLETRLSCKENVLIEDDDLTGEHLPSDKYWI